MREGTTARKERTERWSQLPGLGGRDPNTLVVVVDVAVENLDPATNIEWAYGLQPVYDTLTRLDGTSTSATLPSLAEALEANEDLTTWTARLRDGVVFHDGTSCDARAVKAAIMRTATLKGGQGYVWAFDDPDKQMVVVDPLTLRFDFGYPRPYFAQETAAQYGFWIVSPSAAEAHSTGPVDQGHDWLQSNPVGTGPLRRLRERPRPGDHLRALPRSIGAVGMARTSSGSSPERSRSPARAASSSSKARRTSSGPGRPTTRSRSAKTHGSG